MFTLIRMNCIPPSICQIPSVWITEDSGKGNFNRVNPGKEMGRSDQPAGWPGAHRSAFPRPGVPSLRSIGRNFWCSLQCAFHASLSNDRPVRTILSPHRHFSFVQARAAFCLSGSLNNQWPQMDYFLSILFAFSWRTGSVPSFHLFTLCSILQLV